MTTLDTSELLAAVGGVSDEPDKDIIERFRDDDALDVPIELTDLDLWANYTNDDLYVMDVKVREFFSKTRWRRHAHGGYKTTVPAMFAWIYGRKPEAKDGYVSRLLHTLLKYYCTDYTGASTYKGKKVNRVYRFSPYSVTGKRPYSLRLRLEEANNGANVFRRGPNEGQSKRIHGRQGHREDGDAPLS